MSGKYRTLHAELVWLLVGLVSSACPVLGQVTQKKSVTEADYLLWGRLSMGEINQDGKWLSWNMAYDNGIDTLFLGSAKAKGKFLTFTNIAQSGFAGKQHFATLDRDNSLIVRNLEGHQKWKKDGVRSYRIVADGTLVLVECVDANDHFTLSAIDYMGNELMTVKNVAHWSLSPQNDKLAICLREGDFSYMVTADFVNMQLKKSVSVEYVAFDRVFWDKSGSYFAFVIEGNDLGSGKIFHVNAHTGKVNSYDCNRDKSDESPFQVLASSKMQLTVLEDGKGVVFGRGLRKAQAKSEKELVEIWRSEDKLLYPRQKKVDNSRKVYAAFWNVDAQELLSFSDSKTPNFGLTGSGRYSIVWDSFAYEPQFERDAPVDYFIVDNFTGKKEMFLKEAFPGTVFPFPNSDLIAFDKNGWQIYDLNTRETCATGIGDVRKPWYAANDRSTSNIVPVVDVSEKYLLIGDGCDIWRFDLETKAAARLTNGKETGWVYEVPDENLGSRQTYGLFNLKSLDLSKPNILRMRRADASQTGYCLLLPDGKLQPVVSGKKGFSSMVANSDKTIFAFVSETFEQPKAIEVVTNSKRKVLFESNAHQKKFAWGSAKLIRFSAMGKELSGILYCPANYDPQKRYPLVTEIYERLSDQFFLNRYPTLMDRTGFSVANLTAKGYFVLMPDIEYGGSDPGNDALVCVEAALDAALQKYPIDGSKLGLVGHSFGGYEAAAIACGSSRFATVVAGAAITNLVSSYLTANRNNLRPNYWRYENSQQRIGKGLYEDKSHYVSISPVMNAHRITAPLLLWAGQNDRQIESSNSVELHMALRRLGKKSTLLLYPGEDHSLVKLEARADLTHRIEEWLDHYLMGKSAEWIR